MSYSYENIKIDNLLIDLENPRFDIVTSQKDAITVMIEDQNEKLINLAKDIIEEGLNPSDLPIIVPLRDYEDFYKVLEGNRRITALKLLRKPELVSKINKKILKKFKELSDKFQKNNFDEIRCVIFHNEQTALKWIEMKHSGEMDGVGTVQWDASSKRRFDQRLGKTPKILKILDFVRKKGNLDMKFKLKDIAITNLERLINDPAIREFLGIKFEDDKLYILYPEKEVLKGLKRIIQDLASKKINVNDIRYKEDRLDYLESFETNETPNESTLLKKAIDPLSGDIEEADRVKTGSEENNISGSVPANIVTDQKEEHGNESNSDVGYNNEKDNKISASYNKNVPNPKSLKQSHLRKELIPRKCILKIGCKKINTIYRELKDLDVEKFTNAVAVLFRVFLELSMDHYIELHKISDINFDTPLSKKVQRVTEHLRERNLLTKHEAKPVNKAVSNPNCPLSIDTFNAYVHNKNFQPIAKDLKINWNNIQVFFEKIWME